MSAAEDFTDRFIPDAWHFSTLITGSPAALADFLADEGYREGRITLGETMHRYHQERAVRILVFGSGVMLVYADSWAELRPAIATMRFRGHAILAGAAWTHGGWTARAVSGIGLSPRPARTTPQRVTERAQFGRFVPLRV